MRQENVPGKQMTQKREVGRAGKVGREEEECAGRPKEDVGAKVDKRAQMEKKDKDGKVFRDGR